MITFKQKFGRGFTTLIWNYYQFFNFTLSDFYCYFEASEICKGGGLGVTGSQLTDPMLYVTVSNENEIVI